MPERRDVHAIGIARVDHDAGDASGVVEPHLRPRLAGVDRLEHAPAERDVASDERLARSSPHDVRIGGRDGERADRCDRLAVEDRRPVKTAVSALEDSAGGRAGVDDVRVANHTGYGAGAISLGTDVAELEPREDDRVGGAIRDSPTLRLILSLREREAGPEQEDSD